MKHTGKIIHLSRAQTRHDPDIVPGEVTISVAMSQSDYRDWVRMMMSGCLIKISRVNCQRKTRT